MAVDFGGNISYRLQVTFAQCCFNLSQCSISPPPPNSYSITIGLCMQVIMVTLYCPLEYEKVYLPLYQVADTCFHIQVDNILITNLNCVPNK